MEFPDYGSEVTRALLNLQYLEEGLKMYLQRAYALVRKRAEGRITVRLSRRNIDNKALRALLREFRNFHDDGELISKIESLIEKRNFIAHEAWLLTSEQIHDEKYMQ